MTTTYSQARDEMYGLINTKIKDESTAIMGYIPRVYWNGTTPRHKGKRSRMFLRVSNQIVFESQTTLSTCEGEDGQKRYTTSGLVFIEFYMPRSDNQSNLHGESLAVILRNAFRKAPSGDSGIVYRNARLLNGIPNEEQFYRLNVVTEFEYDEIM